MAEDNLKLLQRYRELIDSKKQERDKAVGKKEALLVELEKDYGLKTIEQAEKKLNRLQKERQELMFEFEEKMDELRDKYEL